jgi:hypothetical protein
MRHCKQPFSLKSPEIGALSEHESVQTNGIRLADPITGNLPRKPTAAVAGKTEIKRQQQFSITTFDRNFCSISKGDFGIVQNASYHPSSRANNVKWAWCVRPPTACGQLAPTPSRFKAHLDTSAAAAAQST